MSVRGFPASAGHQQERFTEMTTPYAWFSNLASTNMLSSGADTTLTLH
ncbi:hypothetical protein ACWGI8_41640 [Streptomyces sp. NPDC054841]